jgi:hypothetical protein
MLKPVIRCEMYKDEKNCVLNSEKIIKSKVKVKLSVGLTKYHAMKMCPVLNQAPNHEDVWGNRGIAALILNLSVIWK